MYLPTHRTISAHSLYIRLAILFFSLVTLSAKAQVPGGFIEQPLTLSTAVVPTLSLTQITSLLPQRGLFTFPAPYNTQAIRLTNATDCGGADCVDAIGYSYWRNINNHVGQDSMLIMVGLDKARGGQGLTLLQYNKLTNALTNLGPVFDSNLSYGWGSGEGWYFSATLPTKIYLNTDSRILRYDVITKQFETIFDVTTKLGSGYILHQMHTSNDDRVHSATVRDATTYAMLGCMAYETDKALFHYYPAIGDYDECQIDKSGQWLVIKENVDGLDGEDNLIINLATGNQRTLLDRAGAGGHSDLGYGYMVASDNWANQSNTQRVWDFSKDPLVGTLVYANQDWNAFTPSHVSHTNSKAGVAPAQQYACGSSANRYNSAEANEILCFPLDGSMKALVVAPVMTNLDTRGSDDYDNSPKGNLDVTGQYFIWTSNMGGARLDAFLVKVPSQLLTGSTPPPPPPPPADTTAPVISSVSAGLVTSATAAIAWTTDEAASTGIDYGTTTAYGNSTAVNVTLGTAHTQTLPGLSAGTPYHYRVKSADAAGNMAVSSDRTLTTLALPDITAPTVALTAPIANAKVSGTVTVSATAADNVGVVGVQFRLDNSNLGSEDQSAPYSVAWNTSGLSGSHTLRAIARDAAGNTTTSAVVTVSIKTTGTPDTTAPVISAVSAGSLTTSAAQISWTTNEPAQDSVEYGTSTAYGTTTAINTTLASTHAVALGSLKSGTLYHYRVKSTDAAGNLATSGDYTFTTVAAVVSPLIGQWQLDGGTIATDTSGNGYNGNLVGSPLWTSGVVGSALAFDGVDDYVEIPHNTALNSYPLTISVWVKTADTGLRGIVNKYLPGSMNGYQVFLNNGNLCAWYFRDGSNYVWDGTACTLSVTGIADNRWHHVAFTVDASGGTLYVDGVSASHQVWTGTPGATTTTQPLDLGRYPGTAAPLLTGTLDEVRIYSRSVTAAEVAGYYASVPVPVGVQPVVWTGLVNVTASTGLLQKTTGCDGCPDAGAASTAQILSGNGYVEFTGTTENLLRVIGMTGINSTTSDADIRYGLRLQGGVAEVREGGVYRWEMNFVAGDVFRIAVENGSVSYAKNGVAFYTSTIAPVYPLRADTTFYSSSGSIQNAVMRTDTP